MVPFYQESQIASSDTLWTPKSVLQMAGGLQLYKWRLRSRGIVVVSVVVGVILDLYRSKSLGTFSASGCYSLHSLLGKSKE